MSPLTVVIVNYNNSNDTILCLESIAKIKFLPSVCLIDNGSDREDVNRLEIFIKKSLLKIILLKNNENIGFGRANNIAINYILKQNNSEFIFFLNNDTVVNPDAISHLERELHSHKHAAIAVPLILFMNNPDTIWYGGGKVNWFKGMPKIDGFGKKTDLYRSKNSIEVDFATGCAMLIRSSVLKELGGFNEKFFLYVEDLELSLRIAKAGWKIKYVPQSIVRHKVQASLRGDSAYKPLLDPNNPNLDFYIYQIIKNVLITMSLHANGLNKVKFIIGFPIFCLFLNLKLLFFGKYKEILSVIKAIKDYIFNK